MTAETTRAPVGGAPDVLVVGEALIDVVHRADGTFSEAPGGSPANVALALGRLERNPRLLTSLGDDDGGRAVRAWLEASGVIVQGRPTARTSTAVAHLDAHGAATYEFAISSEIDADGVDLADVLHIGSIAAILEPGAASVARLLDRHHDRALVCYDPNIRPTLIRDEGAVRQRVLSLIERSDVIKASDEDAAWLYPGEDVAAVARRWLRSGPALVVITKGSAGALAVTRGFEVRVGSTRTEVIDTVGAGDTFMGALIDGLVAEGAFGSKARQTLMSLNKAHLTGLLNRSGRAAAVTVSRVGANPPTRTELGAAIEP
ncbi:fructokinase [Okibacterium sp. HSC-33S16]|uniref:carbohydrate kinase family protein n=1 Tax=Okibacterium sp. HSC-33S16 TaxID=2910965 RepID=UPI0020A1782D|nr:carbohydrate kinase [Okibacterium sp. HSC-33S16]MCP2031117.1 fructokinase [Okibacterium sp. HSC-33S16]